MLQTTLTLFGDLEGKSTDFEPFGAVRCPVTITLVRKRYPAGFLGCWKLLYHEYDGFGMFFIGFQWISMDLTTSGHLRTTVRPAAEKEQNHDFQHFVPFFSGGSDGPETFSSRIRAVPGVFCNRT